MIYTSVIFLAIGVVLVLLSGRQGLPLTLFSIWPSTLRCWFEDDSQASNVISMSSSLRDINTQIRDIGFQILGLKVEKFPLWGRKYNELAYSLQSHGTFAGIVLHPSGEPVSLYFYTPFRNGGFVFTRNFTGRDHEEPPISVLSVPRREPEEVFMFHDGRVEVYEHRGFEVFDDLSKSTRLEATQMYYASKYIRHETSPFKMPAVVRFIASLVFLIIALIIFI